MPQVNIHQAKTHLSRLVEKAAQGEEIVIAKSGKPIARLVALEKPKQAKRKPGALKGRGWVAPDFDAPLPQTLLRQWYGGKNRP
ncbi:MAG: antitoxin [Betaproteobacteria bacterium RIFCSPLOWO2_02_FULL_65_24]|nr:MAG: antitoxin [Betaproteobacteria bacterium RIFCSPLOWO2_02_FULL_65_24]